MLITLWWRNIDELCKEGVRKSTIGIVIGVGIGVYLHDSPQKISEDTLCGFVFGCSNLH